MLSAGSLAVRNRRAGLVQSMTELDCAEVDTLVERKASRMPAYTHYDLLGVTATATGVEIRRRFRELVKKYHPDVTPGVEGNKFRQITEAYRILSNPRTRKAYDRELKEPQEESAPPPESAPST